MRRSGRTAYGAKTTASAVMTATFVVGKIGPSPIRTLTCDPAIECAGRISWSSSETPQARTPGERDPPRDADLAEHEEHQRDGPERPDRAERVHGLEDAVDAAEVVERGEEVERRSPTGSGPTRRRRPRRSRRRSASRCRSDAAQVARRCCGSTPLRLPHPILGPVPVRGNLTSALLTVPMLHASESSDGVNESGDRGGEPDDTTKPRRDRVVARREPAGIPIRFGARPAPDHVRVHGERR